MTIKKGTSIIEIVISAALISMAVIAALSLMNHSQKQSSYARSLAEATSYAQEGADWIRAQRSTLGYSTLAQASDGDYCLNTMPADFTELVSGDCGSSKLASDDQFSRKITLTHGTASIKVIIQVSWLERSTRQATIEMELTQW